MKQTFRTFALLLTVSPVLAQAPSPAPSKEPTLVTTLTIFAGTPSGLWRSKDWANSWEPVVAQGLDGLGAGRAIYPLGPWVFVGGDGGLYTSDDFGETWKHTYSASPVLCILTSRYPMSDTTVFVGTPTGLLRSDDFGVTFHPTTLVGSAVLRLEWPGPDLLAATVAGLRVSLNGGGQFQQATSETVASIAVSSFYSADPVAFAGLAGGGVVRSLDRAASWTSSGLSGRTVNDLIWLGPFLYAATDAGLFRSDDTGRTWQPFGEGVTGAVTRLLFPLAPASGAEAFVATDDGVLWTGDGGLHWRPSGLQKQRVLTLATFPGLDLSKPKKK
jgi:photosystem II stability/assembly factor-like uncharacterized protein